LFNNQRKLVGLALLGVVLFSMGLMRLFLLRFEAGDIYPPYSSLRSDPLGTQALFESLNRMPESSAKQNFRSMDQLPLAPGTTVLICGLGEGSRLLKHKVFENLLDRLADSGGRLVLTFTATSRQKDEEEESEEKAEGTDPLTGADNEVEPTDEIADQSMEESAKEDLATDGSDGWQGMAELGVALKHIKEAQLDDYAARTPHGPDILPAVIPWRTLLSFHQQEADWQTIYAWQNRPVVISRTWGRGTLVLSADSYLFSNEALRNNREPDLLTWYIVPGHDVIFDEFHHGLVRQPGIAALARKYRLHGVFAALMIVALLFVWRQAAVFVPPLGIGEDHESGPPAVGRDTAEGLVNLMRQHIGSEDLLMICYEAWHTHATHRVPEALITQVRQLVQPVETDQSVHDPVQVYRQICKLLEQGKYS